MKYFFTYLLLFTTLITNVCGQNTVKQLNGSFPAKTYLPKEYGANPQIFDIIQDDRGIMYFINQRGILEYDGANWKTIPLGENELKALCLAKGNDGLIYVGTIGDFGVLIPDTLGKLVFSSLVEKLNIDSLGSAAQIVINGKTKYINVSNGLFIIKPGQVKPIKVKENIDKIFLIKEKLFVVNKRSGLYALEGTNLIRVKGKNHFFDKKILDIIEFRDKSLVITKQNEIYELTDKEELIKLISFEDISLNSLIPIGDNIISIGSESNSIVLMNKDFNIINKFELKNELSDPTIKCKFLDKENNLWLGTNFGISKIDINTPIFESGRSSGIKSSILSMSKLNNKLYLSTLDGVYKWSDKGLFERIPGINTDCFGLRTFSFNRDSLLFVADLNSVISIDKNNKKKVLQNGGPYDFKKSPLNPNEVIVLHYNGLANLIYNEGEFTTEKYIKKFSTAEPFNFIVQEDGTIWIGTLKGKANGVYKTHVNVFRDSTVSFEYFGIEKGLPNRAASYLFEHDNNIYVGTDDGLYKYVNGKFIIYNGFGIDFSTTKKGVHRINKDKNGNIWMVLQNEDIICEIGYSSLIDGEYVWNSKMFNQYTEEIAYTILHEENGISWIGGDLGLLRYDSKVVKDYKTPFNALIRSVKLGDDLLFGGAHNQEKKFDQSQSDESNFKVAYQVNKPIKFSFSSTSYYDEEKTVYSFILENYDDDWYYWSDKTEKEYYLPEGTYTFKVKAKNIYGTITKDAYFDFIVLPPWYRTYWAFLFYFIGFILLGYCIIRLSIRRVNQKNIKLEATVKERTKEVTIQKQNAENQRDAAEYQKILVEERNKEILDSISSAKRLQDAILPPIMLIQKKLPNSFIFYQPKDIVAGDFYWMSEVKNKGVLFAAADCTGHGVPGALVSVICSNALNVAVKEFGLTTPSKVLDKVTDIVIETFEKSDEEVKDGMDIALCKLNYSKAHRNATIEFSGANNPLWIISPRKDIGVPDSLNLEFNDIFLHEIKGNRQPVGKHVIRKSFKNYKVELEKGDMFYFFTDGYADQFGGPKGKKYKYKPLKQLLLNNYPKNMQEQKSIIQNEFQRWKGDLEQIDDVCFFGMEI